MEGKPFPGLATIPPVNTTTSSSEKIRNGFGFVGLRLFRLNSPPAGRFCRANRKRVRAATCSARCSLLISFDGSNRGHAP